MRKKLIFKQKKTTVWENTILIISHLILAQKKIQNGNKYITIVTLTCKKNRINFHGKKAHANICSTALTKNDFIKGLEDDVKKFHLFV